MDDVVLWIDNVDGDVGDTRAGENASTEDETASATTRRVAAAVMVVVVVCRIMIVLLDDVVVNCCAFITRDYSFAMVIQFSTCT